MPLGAGDRLGPYEIRSALGAGGMGEVYRAHDTRLARDVAVKVLPRSVAGDADRLRRFEQEARAASALSHPNVFIVYDVGQDNGVPYIVSELLEGKPLRAALSRGALPIRTVLDYALQIARGLTAAHERGIIHRDLKPENVFVTDDGKVKILDFGLAKLTTDVAVTSAFDAASLATNTLPGVVLGTVGYMSPEQVRGEPADHRSDVFSFGTVLHEMLWGKSPFERDSPYETLHAILNDDPEEHHNNGPVATSLTHIVRRCLEKTPARRFQAMCDVAFAIEAVAGISTPAAHEQVETIAPGGWRTRLLWVLLAGVIAVSAIAWVWRSARGEETPPRVMRFEIVPPSSAAFTPVGTRGISSVLAPDGHAAVLVVTSEGRTQLYLRALDRTTLSVLAGTEDASNPFWSPDSRWIGFFQAGMLRKVEPGGSPQTICAVVGIPSGTWGADDVIIIATNNGLYRVASSGGQPARFVTLPRNEFAFWPSFLPDGRHFLYLRIRLPPNGNEPTNEAKVGEVRVRSIEPGGSETTLLAVASRAVYAEPGYLLFVREGTLLAQPFDVRSMRLTGEPASIADNVQYFEPIGSADLSASRTGILAYQAAASSSRFEWYTRDGAAVQAATDEGFYDSRFRLSPDGTRLALTVLDRRTGNSDVWLVDLTRGTQSRFTFDPGYETAPVWSPDGGRIVFSADRGAPPFLHVKALGDEASGQPLVPPQFPQIACDWSKTPDGEFIVYESGSPESGADLFAVPVSGNRTPRPFVRSRFNETDARFSPDGRRVVYVSDESGRREVYVRPFANGTEHRQVSIAGGSSPRWSRNGREVFYLGRDGRLMSVTVSSTSLDTSAPKALFTIGAPDAGYEVSPDGQRFLVNRLSGRSIVTVVVDWLSAVRR